MPFPSAARKVDVGFRHPEVERAVERLRRRPGPERAAHAIQLSLVELDVLLPQRGRRHYARFSSSVDVGSLAIHEHQLKAIEDSVVLRRARAAAPHHVRVPAR